MCWIIDVVFMRLSYFLLISGVVTQLAPNSQPTQHDTIIDKVVLLSLLIIWVLLSCSMSSWWNHKLCLGVVHNLMLTSLLPT